MRHSNKIPPHEIAEARSVWNASCDWLSTRKQKITAAWGDTMVSGSAQRTVLVVEDDPCIRGLLALLLQDEAYAVVTAEDGQDALTKLEGQKPDAMVLDLMLPEVDGWHVIEVLDRDADEQPIPIIAVTAGLGTVAVGERGVRAFLSKPFEIDTLLLALDQVLQ